MDKAALLALADRVEALTGPDRRTDYLIMCATVPTGKGYIWDPEGDSHRYTASLDAAMTLVPPWACPRIFHNQDMLWECRLENGLGIPFKDYNGLAQAICLAILSAALRAIAAQ